VSPGIDHRQWHPDPAGFGGQGTVFIVYHPNDEHPVSGHWETSSEGRAIFLEPLPICETLWQAVEWGRQRAPTVLLRFDDSWGGGLHWFIGEIPDSRSEVEFLDPYPKRDQDGVWRGTHKRPGANN